MRRPPGTLRAGELYHPEYLQQLSVYNYWVNSCTLNAAEELTTEQLHHQQSHSKGSIQSDLLHIMSVEWT